MAQKNTQFSITSPKLSIGRIGFDADFAGCIFEVSILSYEKSADEIDRPKIPVDCEGQWGQWSACSETCGDGTQTKSYSITVDAENGGNECPHAQGDTVIQTCNLGACPVPCSESQVYDTGCGSHVDNLWNNDNDPDKCQQAFGSCSSALGAGLWVEDHLDMDCGSGWLANKERLKCTCTRPIECRCSPPDESAKINVIRNCPQLNASCFNEGYIRYDTLEAAWDACGKIPECEYVQKYRYGGWYLRRLSDPIDRHIQGYGFNYDCEKARRKL